MLLVDVIRFLAEVCHTVIKRYNIGGGLHTKSALLIGARIESYITLQHEKEVVFIRVQAYYETDVQALWLKLIADLGRYL